MIKKILTTKNEIKVEGILRGFTNKGLIIEDEKTSVEQTLSFESILLQFQNKSFKLGIAETSKDEEEI